jgi:hypothetical protein
VLHQRVHVVEVAGAGSSPQSEHLVRCQVVWVQDGPDVEHDAWLEPAAVGEDLDGAFASVSGIDSDDAVVGGWPVGVPGFQSVFA